MPELSRSLPLTARLCFKSGLSPKRQGSRSAATRERSTPQYKLGSADSLAFQVPSTGTGTVVACSVGTGVQSSTWPLCVNSTTLCLKKVLYNFIFFSWARSPGLHSRRGAFPF